MKDGSTYEEVAGVLGVPKAIASKREHERALRIIEALISRGENITTAESALLDTWARLVSMYEDEIAPPALVSPVDMIEFLMDQRGLRNVDLIPAVFERASHASGVISGKRAISKAVALKLARFFRVPVAFFLSEAKPKKAA